MRLLLHDMVEMKHDTSKSSMQNLCGLSINCNTGNSVLSGYGNPNLADNSTEMFIGTHSPLARNDSI
jgi:hypothetical protein